MGKKAAPSNAFRSQVDLMESRERNLSLYLLITTLLLVVILSVAVMMDSEAAPCPYPPHHITLFVPLAPGASLEKVFSRLQREETPGFNVVWSGNYSSKNADFSSLALQAALERNPWSTVEYKDTKNSILAGNSMNLKTIQLDERKDTRQILCEQSTHRCPLNPQIDLEKKLTASVNPFPFGSAPVYERCVTQRGKVDAVKILRNIVRSFPRGIHPEFFANSNTRLLPVDRFKVREMVVAKFSSSWVGKHVTLTLTEAKKLPISLDDEKRENSRESTPDSSSAPSSYVLTVAGDFSDPYSTETEVLIRALRRHYWDTLGDPRYDGGEKGELLDIRVGEKENSFLKFVQRSPLLL